MLSPDIETLPEPLSQLGANTAEDWLVEFPIIERLPRTKKDPLDTSKELPGLIVKVTPARI
jgi:hypothetical protein